MADSELVGECRVVVRQLLDKYQWRLLTEAEFVVQLGMRAQSNQVNNTHELLKLAKALYSERWYEACRDKGERREQAFQELAGELYKMARQKYGSETDPQAVQEISQTALILVWEQLDHCQKPAAFMKFCLYKLWNAGTVYLRDKQKAAKYTTALPSESDLSDD